MAETAHYPWHGNTLGHVRKQLHESRLPHAMLFRARPNYGDQLLSRSIAQMILCDEFSACIQCKHCRLVAEGSHSNVLSLDVVNKKVGIAEVRELESRMWHTSMFDKPKIAIIDGIDLLSIGAQNALLKTLEEPPKNTFFVLSVENISRVLPTIMSRVQRLQHEMVSPLMLSDWLKNTIKTALTESDITKSVALADSAPLRALELLQSPDLVRSYEQEKALFAQFLSGTCSAIQLSESLEKNEMHQQLRRWCHYTENTLYFLFEKTADKNSDVPDKRTDNREGNSVQYATWNGISMRALYRLHDVLSSLLRLADTNVNMHLQLITSLTDWQNERRK